MTHFEDEFRFMAGDAESVGRTGPLPEVTRVSVSLADGRCVSALRFEPERAPKLVFLHGMGLNAHGFDPVVLAIAEPALSIDLPGHGASDWRDDAQYRPDLLAEDLLTVLHELAPEPFTLVGHSLGGLTAALLAPRLGDRLNGLVIIDITPGVQPVQDAGAINDFIHGQSKFDSLEEMVDRAIAFGIGQDRAALTRGVALNSRRRTDGTWEWAHHFAHMQAEPMAGFGEDDRPFAPIWQPLQAVQQAGVPVSLIRATQGLVGDVLAAEWSEHLPGSPVSTVSGPHNLHEAAPRELAAALGHGNRGSRTR